MTRERQSKVVVFADARALALAVSDWILDLTIAKEGSFAIALSGGSTPRLLYESLAESPFRNLLPWRKMHVFWGDERFVPRTDTRSNYGMTHETLLSRVPIPAQNIHPIRTEGMDIDAAAETYQHELMTFYGADRLSKGRPLFDVTLLGLGTDGHTASLFPETAALDERKRWVVAVDGVGPEARITLTPPALESSRHLAFLVEGVRKRAIFERIREGSSTLPAARLWPIGEEVWFLDQAAAGSAATAGSINLRRRATCAK